MKKCFACGNVQETGNFCAKCGGALTDVAATNDGGASTPNPNQPMGQADQPTPDYQQSMQVQQNYQQPPFEQQGQPFGQQPYQQQGQQYQQYQQAGPAQPNVHVERVKDQSKMFFSYFAENLKSPSSIFGRGESQFVNGIITIVAYAILFGLSLFFIANEFVSAFSWGTYNAGSEFFPIFGSGLIGIIILVALVIISLFVINKLFGPDKSFKEIISNYGALIIPSLLLMVLVFVFFLIKSFEVGSILLMISLFVAFLGVPLYIITRLLGMRSKTLDPFYAYLLYIVLFIILYVIVNNIFLADSIGRYIDNGWF